MFSKNITNVINATLTPKDGYDKIFIFLGGISDVSNKYFDFLKVKVHLFQKEQKFIPFLDHLDKCNL